MYSICQAAVKFLANVVRRTSVHVHKCRRFLREIPDHSKGNSKVNGDIVWNYIADELSRIGTELKISDMLEGIGITIDSVILDIVHSFYGEIPSRWQ